MLLTSIVAVAMVERGRAAAARREAELKSQRDELAAEVDRLHAQAGAAKESTPAGEKPGEWQCDQLPCNQSDLIPNDDPRQSRRDPR